MANKRKSPKTRDPNQITAAETPSEDEAVTLARTVLHPTAQAAFTVGKYNKAYGDLDLVGLADSLAKQTNAVNEGDLKRGVEMMTAQAHTLDAIFNYLSQQAINAKYMDHLDRFLKLALRAQSQCRATWEALSAMKNPPMRYIGQANIAHGPQQVNNAPAKASEATHAGGKSESAKQTIGEDR